ncbi:cysteine hydrolase [Evansella sp. AB-P1]|uniref:cysteine hydrolase family protein n=1 Tax=Evansella sp. AB-P1 TaxID=3037653 RepID=UPI00241F2ED1|nr:isochorismatase family cysteine hydrolase [Evansella sp. AB-P1]MDG5786199.1 cysteine hydrolase [Evansella sp. AB-P1]
MEQRIDPSKTILLSLHMQHDIVSKDGKFADFFADQAEEREVVKKSAKLINSARLCNVPVIHATVCFEHDYSDLNPNSPLLAMVKQTNALRKNTKGAEILEEVKPLKNEVVISHQRVGPYENTELSTVIKENGTENIIILGVATNIVVETSARIASDEGYHVYVVEDCCSTDSIEAHEATLKSLSLLTTITTLEDIISSFR